MSPIETIALIALIGYAIYRQTHRSEVQENGRFKLAVIYAIVGAAVGGFTEPHGTTAVMLLVASVALSVVVGLARGVLTRVWRADDGRVMRQGTVLTVGLFLGMIAVKVGMGAYADLHHIQDSGGFGEIMVMMALMVAAQAEIMHRRALALRAVDPAGRATVLA